jgi:TNF receptor-associated protein 1
MEFKAETRQLLDIVINSLYQDKEVFLRELISNASDACEKLRHLQQNSSTTTSTTSTRASTTLDDNRPLEIRIEVDETTSTIKITDSGIGMSKDEMIANLGTIAKSGSLAFRQELERAASGQSELDASRGIIGKFGVGFYSVFMVASHVEVRSKCANNKDEADNNEIQVDAPGWVWTSDGKGTFDVFPLAQDIRQDRGTSIVIHLHSDYWHLCDETRLVKILKEYSNFVQFPIYVNGALTNTIQAVWAQDPKQVERDTYVEFYKYIANAVDDPMDIYHFRAEVPLDVKALFYIPSFHSEKYGMDRMKPGVSLYSRKVLIEADCADILPEWMRFVKGVVDSEDLPLQISREKPQDSKMIGKLRKTLTRKFLAHLETMAKYVRLFNVCLCLFESRFGCWLFGRVVVVPHVLSNDDCLTPDCDILTPG